MKTDIINKLNSILYTLNNIEVKGEGNLSSLYGSISILKDVTREISETDFIEEEK